MVVSVGAVWVFEHFYKDAHEDILEGVIIFVTAMLLLLCQRMAVLAARPTGQGWWGISNIG